MTDFLKNKKLLLILVLLLAIFFRFNNLNWDENFHLHPDERFLTMVGNAMQIPQSLSLYLDQQKSPMNPANINFPFFVYGVFPIVLNKILAVLIGNDNYNLFTTQGRFLSALFDVLTVIFVFKTAKLLVGQLEIRNWKLGIIPIWSAFFYAIAVLPIQLSHFFAVDTFLNFFMFASFYFSLRFWSRSAPQNDKRKDVILARDPEYSGERVQNLILSAIFFGLALASKITAIYILPLNLFFLFLGHSRGSGNPVSKLYRLPIRSGMTILLKVLFYLFISYVVLRFTNPYYFESSNFLNLIPNKLFIQNLQSLKSFEGKDVMYPPAIQWISKNPTFSLVNLAVFGVGIPYFIFVIIGMIFVISNYQLSIILLWIAAFFLYQSFQFVKAMRYFIFIYPFLAIFAGIGMDRLSFWLVQNRFWMCFSTSSKLTRMTLLPVLRSTFYVLITVVLLIWPLAFSSIYTNKNSRAAASEWMYKNLPNESVILSEHWDDALPLSVQQNYGKQFTIKELPVFAPDNVEKWSEINSLLKQADYYILSSNRGWGSIPTVPEKYPRMSKFYKDLLTNNLRGFKKIGEFVAYPKIQFQISNFKFQISIPDQWADESYTVYDHPKVLIFERL